MTNDEVLAAPEAIPDSGLSLVSQLCADMRALATQIATAEEALAQMRAQYAEIEQRRLPDAMAEIGFDTVTLRTGEKIAVAPEYHCGIPVARKPEAFAWLRENGFGDLIKTRVTLEFGRGEESLAEDVRSKLVQADPERPITLEDSVHPSTLKSLVKTQFESGNPVPEDLFGVHTINRAKIIQPKRRS